ncbi:hypothetical protein HAX54_003763 [Datura stramonium]|uniref:Transmembrane protein n=1 Tax=Datura stramonium TaxID=4076 RepID=A0ABS8T745_DATST|nr:hypothetical protein [Datura stramonium]
MKYQNLLQSVAKFTMKKFTQLLASISLFSFIFSYYSLNFSFSSFPTQLLSHAMDKNYVFLICNGIFLVLLANTSSEEKEEEEEEEKAEEDGFLNEFQEEEKEELPLYIDTRVSYSETSEEEVHVQHEDEKVMSIQLSKSHELPLNVENLNMKIVEYKQDETTSEGQVLNEEKEEGGIGGEECCRTYEIIVADNCEENDLFTKEEEEEESDEPLNKLSTEELNKKFEEFIRRMKEEIRIDARQQLVLVK